MHVFKLLTPSEVTENGVFAEANELLFRCCGQQQWHAQGVDANYCFAARSLPKVQIHHA